MSGVMCGVMSGVMSGVAASSSDSIETRDALERLTVDEGTEFVRTVRGGVVG